MLESLRADEVAAHYGITGAWRGRWMRSRRCPAADHHTDAMGLARDGHWHCHACDIGGDLLKLIAIAEGIDIRADFPKVLAVAAAIAGVDDDDFGGASRPPPPPRPAPPPIEPITKRLEAARRRAAWTWERMFEPERAVEAYLRSRCIDLAAVLARDELRATPLKVSRDYINAHPSRDLEKLARMFAVPGVAVPVRSPQDGRLVDIRVRRYEPADGQPKVIGMLGGVVREGAELYGCYGKPHDIPGDAAFVVVVEGLADYLTALTVWPNAAILGATDAGSYPLVAAHAAAALAERGDDGKLLLVEQTDEERIGRDGKIKPGAADLNLNRKLDAASKRAIAILGPQRVGWLGCEPHKDLNALICAHEARDPQWWTERVA